MEQLARVVEYQGATVALLDDDRLECVAARGFAEPATRMAFSLDVSDNAIFQQMVAAGAPVVIADVSQDPRWEWVAGVEFTRAWIGAPLGVKGRIIGQLSVYHPRPGRYGTEEGQTLLAFARQAAVAIENARLHEETRRWADRLHVLYEVSTDAATAASLEETLQRTVQVAQQTMGADNVALLLLEPETGELVIRAWAGFPGGLTLMRRQVGVGVPGWVVQTGQPALIPDVCQDARYRACDEDARSELCVPLQVGQHVIGALNLESRQPAAFTDDDLHLLTTLAGHLAAIIENARLYDEIKAWAAELEQRMESRTQELQETQSHLLHAERLAALGRLSAGIGHEIGHPLGLIHGYVELLAEEQPHLPYLSPVRNAIEQLTVLMAQLRDFSRPTAEEWSLVSVNEIVDRVLALVSQELRQGRIKASRCLAADLPPVEADARQLEQVFLNLALNARDAMPQGGELIVRTFYETDRVIVGFADTGMGIPPENLERIFEPYFTTKSDKGTGLGLAICR